MSEPLTLRQRTQEIAAEYWAVREKQSERVAVAQMALALASAEAARTPDVEALRPVIDKALTIQQRARRTAISSEDWRYTNGYNDCLALVLDILDPDDRLRWVRDPDAEALRLARATLVPATPEAKR